MLAAGIVPSAIASAIPVVHDPRGRIAVDGTMRSRSHPNVWALGDCAAIPGPDGRPYPALAQHTVREARQLARNIRRVIDGRAPAPFVFQSLGTMASLGHTRAVARVFGLPLTGFAAWWIRRTYYLFQMPRWDRRLRIVLDWTVALFFRPDITEVELRVEREQVRQALEMGGGTADLHRSRPGRGTLRKMHENTIALAAGPNSHAALRRRLDAARLTWRGPALMLFARAACAVGAQAVVAAVFALRASPTPWHDAEPWLPVYGTLIDAGCLALLWRLTRREGIRLFDLVGFERPRLARDTLLGFALIPVSLVFILGGIYAAGWLVYGTLTPPYLFGPLPLPAALYGVLVWPFIWGLTEQMTYNGYLVPRFQVLCQSTSLAIVLVAFTWSLQHSFMPLTFDARFMAFRLLASVPNTIFQALLYLRLRRLVPLAIAHALMDGASVLVGVLLPLVRAWNALVACPCLIQASPTPVHGPHRPAFAARSRN